MTPNPSSPSSSQEVGSEAVDDNNNNGYTDQQGVQGSNSGPDAINLGKCSEDQQHDEFGVCEPVTSSGSGAVSAGDDISELPFTTTFEGVQPGVCGPVTPSGDAIAVDAAGDAVD